MDVKYWLNGGVRFFVVAAKNSYSSVPIRKLFSPNITSTEITGLDPYTVYNVSVVVIDGNRSEFKSTVLQARTDKEDCGYVQSNTLRSPGYPSHYPNNMDCVYRVPIPIDKDLWIFFSYFSLEDNKNCTRDYLKISDGSNRRIGTYCGYQTGRSVDVVGRTAVFKFVANRIVRYQGFTLSLVFTPKVCGFEYGLCRGWYQSYNDDFDWTRHRGSTSSSNTGPSSGHGGYGFYMCIKPSRWSYIEKKAKLLFLPPSSIIGKMSCLKFYYHMYGATVNRLNVFNGDSMEFTKSGQQGNRWLYAEMTVLVRNKITFEGITGASYTGVIAIDDVLLTDGFCKDCMEALNDSFGHLNITYNVRFSPDCVWTIENSGISEVVAILSIDELQLGYCSGFIKVLDGVRTQVFSREGCLSNHTSSMFLEIAIQQSQNLTIQVSLHNKQSYARLTFGISKDGVEGASLVAGWNVTLVDKSSNSLHLQWMDVKYWLNGGARFFVVIAKSSSSSVPVRKLFAPNITSAEITGLDPYTVYNVSVVVIDGNGSAFKSTALQARTDTEVSQCNVLLPVLTRFINTSLKSGQFPVVWKEALVLPLLKKPGLDILFKNFRPVSNLPFVSKLTESAVYNQTHGHICKNNLYPPNQSSYRKNYSTETALLRVKNDILLNMNKQHVTLLILLDLSAAFDTVDHNVLLRRLHSKFGISGTALEWFSSYLRGRSQRVMVQGNLSQKLNLEFGVPQGSCLGPLLFTIYASKLFDVIKEHLPTVHCYADDTQPLYVSFSPNKSTGQSEAVNAIQHCVKDVRNWMNNDKLLLNDDKTEFLMIVCGFEDGLCRGWHQSYADDFDWTRHSVDTWPFNTGPSSGHGGYGFYMYIQTWSRFQSGDKAKLLFTPPNLLIGAMSCLRFYYHMYGATVNRLNVFNGNSVVFTKSGQQGNRWLYAEMTVLVRNKITFEGIKGASYTGDIAIDDVSLTDGFCKVCMEALNGSFGHLNITYNERFSPDCIWTLENSGRSELVAIVSIDEVQLGYCSDFIKVLDGVRTQVFSRKGCLSNHTSSMFLEIAIQQSQNLTIQVSLHKNQSYARLTFGISKDGLEAASLLAGWNVTLVNKSCSSLHLQWMDVKYWLYGGVRFFVVAAKNSYSSVPIRKLFSPNITSAEITGLDPYTEYNVSVVAIDDSGSPFNSSVIHARTDESVPNSEPTALIVTGVTATSLTVHWNPLPQQYHNGRLLGYRVFFRKAGHHSFPVDASSVAVYNSTWVTLNNLEPVQPYEIYVTAFTSKGDGPRSVGYFLITARSLFVNRSFGLIDIAQSADNNPLNCSWTIGNVGITNAVATFIIQRINISGCREHVKIVEGSRTSKYYKRGRLHITHEHTVDVPFLSSVEIKVTISLLHKGSNVKAQYLVLSTALYSAPGLPGWNLNISNETSSSFSVQWTNLTTLLGRQIQCFIILLKSNRNNNSNAVHKIVNGREERKELTGLLSSSKYIVEVFGIDEMGQPYKTLEVQAMTLDAICGMRQIRSTVVVGGTAAPINSWPWQALLSTRDGRQFCGGSLVEPEWVITATHCVVGKWPSNIQVTLGAHYYSAASVVGTEQYFDVVQIVEHENYNSPKRWSNDIALLKLSRPALLQNGVGLVCLSDDQFQLPFTETSKKCWTTGWGTLSYGGFKPIVLMQVDLPLVSPQRCSHLHLTRYDANTMICADRVWGGVGACHGDSGGPLVCEFNGKWYLEGVTSWIGLPCGEVNKPAIFAYVRKFKSWIIRKMNNSLVPNMATNCGYTIDSTLKSPGYPSFYPKNTLCVYEVPIPCDEELVIYFIYFQLEYKRHCSYDYLKITDGRNRAIGTFCGQQTGRSILVNDSIAVLTFKTDRSVQFNGFHLSFSFFPRGNATLRPFVSPTPTTTQPPTTVTSPG
ncbi:uncharacterized protein LOC114956623 [Acropora millepora]|uniref:uncharacterized protein LOC114956623 n=1 Tax=Acropora millepora TaxID=45264 RepID=UPI001CF47AE2|nr:uncharacterized protein LOC114956623 [Acropora millepora]